MMDRDRLETITRQWISLWRAPVDWALFDRLHADDFEDASPGGRASTKQSFGEGIAKLIEAFPDLETRVDDLVVDEATGRVAVRWAATGTNRRGYLGVGPTGRRTTITGIEIIEIRDNRIARRWGEWDITNHTRGGG